MSEAKIINKYDLFQADGEQKLQIQRCDENSPDEYTDDHAAVDFVRDLESKIPRAINIAKRLINQEER